MSELIIIGYEDEAAAQQAYDKVQELQRDYVVSLNGLALVRVDQDGRTKVETPTRLVGVSAASGALWGALFGVLFLMPGVGMLLGGALGALMGQLNKVGINDGFKRRVQGLMHPNSAAVVLMASKITEDKFRAALAPFGGTVLQTSLSEEDEHELAEELKAN